MYRVAVAVIEKDGKILIARRRKEDPLKDKWEFPGGKIEGHESPEECLKREVTEELGIAVTVGEFICSSTHEYSHIAIELLVYRVRWDAGELTAHEHEEFRWINPSELTLYDFPEANRPAIEALVEQR